MSTENDILSADNILETGRGKGFLYVFISSFIFVLFVLMALVLFPVKTPMLADYTEDLASFKNKTEKFDSNVTLSQSEVNAFLNNIIHTKSYLYSAFVFPKTINVFLSEKNSKVFLTGSFMKIKFVLSSTVQPICKKSRLINLVPLDLSIGKLSFPKKFITSVLEFFNMSLVYSLPLQVKKVQISDGVCVLFVDEKTAAVKAKAVDKKNVSDATDTKSDNKNMQMKVVDNRKIKKEAISKKADSIKPNKVSESRAANLHKTAVYFHKSRKYDFALKYYQQINDQYPEYTKIAQVRKQIRILKKYKEKEAKK